MSARIPVDRDEFRHCRLNTLAETILTDREYAVWLYTLRERWTARQVAEHLNCSRVTVERDLAIARRKLREAMEHLQEGRNPFAIPVQRGHSSALVPDRTPATVAHHLERQEKKQGRMKAA